MRRLYHLPLCIAILVISGCDRSDLSSDEQEERDPLVKTGVAYMEGEQWNEAVTAFKEALDINPSMAKPHLDLALIYQQHITNYVHAIYHYDRYLELRPESEKAAFIREQRDKVKRAMEVTIIQQSPDVRKLIADAQQIMKENQALKQQLTGAAPNATSREQTPAVTSAEPSPPSSAAPPASAGPEAGHKIYTVKAGDTLTKIAAAFYGDSADWEPIYEANRDSLSSPSALRVGQTLVIPMP